MLAGNISGHQMNQTSFKQIVRFMIAISIILFFPNVKRSPGEFISNFAKKCEKYEWNYIYIL